MYIGITPFSLKSCFGHMGEALVWSTWLCSAHPPFQATSPPLSVTCARVHSRGSFKLQSSHLILNFVLEMSHTQQKYTCSLASGCRKVLFAGSRNDPELLFLILVGYFLKLWCCRLSDTTWATECYRCPSYVHIYEVQQQSFPKYPEVRPGTFQTWIL